MTPVTLAVSEAVWMELCGKLNRQEETAGLLLAGIANADQGQTICVNSIRWVPNDAYEVREARRLKVSSQGWMPSLGEAAAQEWQPIFFHTHPNGDPHPSSADKQVRVQLDRDFRVRAGCPFASLILGGVSDAPTFTGEFDGDRIERVRIVGKRLQMLTAANSDNTSGEPLSVFDRQIRAFGKDGQHLLNQLRFGVVGAGGTGSAVLEQLVRLGAGEVVLIDDDHITETNPTRIHESCMDDVGKQKVDVLSNAANRIGLGTKVIPVNGKVTTREVFETLRGCDAVFGCTDDNAGRGILSRFAYYYVTPVFDVGVLVGSQDGQISVIEARLTTMSPGTPCLFCRGRINSTRLREEMQTGEEVEDLVREGYAQGLEDRDPAVVAYTTMIASMAVDELLQRLFGFGPEHPSSEVLIRIPPRELRSLGGKPVDGHFCADLGIVGRADREPPLGMAWL
jgi:molybdopterin/thiamine biosynthesis adenylyltransferase/proteasome lid subunit RPN8/RPN11